MVILTIVAIFTSVALTSLVVSHRFKNQQEDDIYMNIDNTDKIPEAGVGKNENQFCFETKYHCGESTS